MATRTAVLAGFLAVCLAVSLLPAGAVGQAEPAVGFGEATTVAAQGDVATVDLRVRNTEAATLRVRAADQSYRADVDVRDGDGDGRIRVRLDTFRGLDADTTVDVSTVDPADDAELVSETTTQEGLVFADGRYNLIASTESTTIAAVLRLQPPPAGRNATPAVPPETPPPAHPPPRSRAAAPPTPPPPPCPPAGRGRRPHTILPYPPTRPALANGSRGRPAHLHDLAASGRSAFASENRASAYETCNIGRLSSPEKANPTAEEGTPEPKPVPKVGSVRVGRWHGPHRVVSSAPSEDCFKFVSRSYLLTRPVVWPPT